MARKYYRINQHIQVPEVRLLDSTGKQVGIVSKDEALKKALDEGIDLVEVAPGAKPPVCKLVDFKKFLYQEEKKQREEKKKSHTSETKEVHLGPFISEHDLKVKVERAKKFLKDGHKVKIILKFRGRQITHPEFGQKTLHHFLECITAISKIEREPHFEGKMLVASVSAVKSAVKYDKNEDKKVSS